MTRGLVFEIQHFSIHDGPGIRTTVFLKGCPLRCLWCHNPESQNTGVEIYYSPDKCIHCRYCESVCTNGAHVFSLLAETGALQHRYLRENCARCGKCTTECYSGALELIGRPMEAEQVIAEVLRDAPFYQARSGQERGGMTLSGGEPLAQFAFARDLLARAKAAGLHTCIETSGSTTAARLLAVLPLVDVFYFDVKETDSARHRAYTGMGNRVILKNLETISRGGANIVLRCPIIPGLNDRAEHFAAVAALANRLDGARAVHVLPYHPLGTDKLTRLDRARPFEPPPTPSDAQAAAWVAAIQAGTSKPVSRS